MGHVPVPCAPWEGGGRAGKWRGGEGRVGEGRGGEGTGGTLCYTALCVLHDTALSVSCCAVSHWARRAFLPWACCAPLHALCELRRLALCALCNIAWRSTPHAAVVHGTGFAAPHWSCRAARHCVWGGAMHE